MKKHLLILLSGILISACATLPSNNIPQSFSTTNENGMIVGSISFKNEKPIFNSYFIHYIGEHIKTISGNKGINIKPEQIAKMKFNPDFFDGDKAVYYFAITEPEGNYRFSNFKIVGNGGFVISTANIPIDISFKTEKGKVKYLGEIYLDYNKSSIKLNDEKKRDLEKLKEKFPNLIIE